MDLDGGRDEDEAPCRTRHRRTDRGFRKSDSRQGEGQAVGTPASLHVGRALALQDGIGQDVRTKGLSEADWAERTSNAALHGDPAGFRLRHRA